MTLKLFNTLTGRQEPLRPLTAGRVGMYVCGITAYDVCHLGHARSAFVFDLVRRVLASRGLNVTYVKNFTDLDDKILHRARVEGRPWQALAEYYMEAYRQDMARLGAAPADIEPKATEYLPQMIELIRRLEASGHAYAVGGDVFYAVETFPTYGWLSRRRPDELLAGARVEVDERKRDPMDFVLWKSAKPDEPTWASPWGPGRPGWHIECSAMAMAHLGEQLDLHGGGLDLIFPHHENEIAQSEAATEKRFVQCWLHNGLVTVDREKMSKSVGNFFTIREIFEASPYPAPMTAEILRYLLASTHYRHPLDFSDESVRAAKAALDHCYILLQRLDHAMRQPHPSSPSTSPSPRGGEGRDEGRGDGSGTFRASLDRFARGVEAALDADLNTALALGELQQFRAEVNAALDRGLTADQARAARDAFRRAGALLNVLTLPAADWITAARPFHLPLPQGERGGVRGAGEEREAPHEAPDEAKLRDLLREREEARRRQDWARADAIRVELSRQGVILEDQPDGTTQVRR